MRAAGEETRLGEGAPVPLRRAGDEALAIAVGIVLAAEGLEERDALAELAEAGQAASQFARRYVVHDVRTDQQIDRGPEPQVLELAEAHLLQVAARPVARDRVGARIDTAVVQRGPQ